MSIVLGTNPVRSEAEHVTIGWVAPGDKDIFEVPGRADLLVEASARDGLQHPTLHR